MPRVDPPALESINRAVYEHLGAPPATAGAVAESLVAADLCGHRSHGTRATARYARLVDEGRIDPTASPEVVREDATTATVDGNALFGQVVGREAVDLGVGKAREAGVATVGVRNATHLGRVGEWAERAVAADVAFLGFVCNPTSRYVAPAGSAQGRLSTNPVCIGLPTFGATEFPLVLDVATSQVAHGKIRQRKATGTPVPDGWTNRYPGFPDPERFYDGGALLPLGGTVAGYKGTGLAVMGELLAANLGDGHVAGQEEARWGNQAMFHCFDLERFTTREAVRDRVAALRSHLRSAEPDPDLDVGRSARGDRFLLPGEAEHESRQEYTEHGIPVAGEDAAALLALAGELGVSGSVTAPLRN